MDIVVVSDPPFGQGKAGVPGDHTGDQRAAWEMFRPRGGFIYASPEPHLLRQSWDGIEAAGGTVVHMLIEDKGRGLWWADRLQNRFDVILFFERTDSVWLDGRKACSILKPDLSHEARDEREEMAGDHTTPKHVSTISELIRLVTHEGDTVLDPFAGSGTTLIAAHRTKRRFVGCEIDPGTRRPWWRTTCARRASCRPCTCRTKRCRSHGGLRGPNRPSPEFCE
jgi:hypothetical protein